MWAGWGTFCPNQWMEKEKATGLQKTAVTQVIGWAMFWGCCWSWGCNRQHGGNDVHETVCSQHAQTENSELAGLLLWPVAHFPWSFAAFSAKTLLPTAGHHCRWWVPVTCWTGLRCHRAATAAIRPLLPTTSGLHCWNMGQARSCSLLQCLTSMQQQSAPFLPHLSISPHPGLPKTPLPPLTLALRVPLSVLQSPTGPSDIPNPQIHHFPLLISYQGQADPPQSWAWSFLSACQLVTRVLAFAIVSIIYHQVCSSVCFLSFPVTFPFKLQRSWSDNLN